MTNPKEICRAVRLASLRVDRGLGGVIVIADSDDECPVELARVIAESAKESGASCPISVVIANREYESIFLAAAPSLVELNLAVAVPAIPDPETVRDAKGRLKAILVGNRYKETQEQARLTANIDLEQALNCRWFRKLEKEIQRLLKLED
jgi:hypothetical protein